MFVNNFYIPSKNCVKCLRSQWILRRITNIPEFSNVTVIFGKKNQRPMFAYLVYLILIKCDLNLRFSYWKLPNYIKILYKIDQIITKIDHRCYHNQFSSRNIFFPNLLNNVFTKTWTTTNKKTEFDFKCWIVQQLLAGWTPIQKILIHFQLSIVTTVMSTT